MTINTPNRALIERTIDCSAPEPFTDWELSDATLNRLLDAARAEGPVQASDGYSCGCKYADGCSCERVATPPADEVGRGLRPDDLAWLATLRHEITYDPFGARGRENARIDRILSHVSRLEGALEVAKGQHACCVEGQNQTLAERKLAVEALEKIEDGGEQSEYDELKTIARKALSSLRHEDMPLAPGGDVDALEGLIEANKPFVAMLHALREDEGDSVTLLCDNPEGPPNNAIVCNGGWTDWEDRRFNGETIEQAVRLAYLAKRSPINPPLAPTNMDTSGQSGGEW